MSVMIDDPVDFDIWGKIKDNESLAFSKWLADRVSVPAVDIYRAVSPAVKSGKYVQIFTGYGWNSIREAMNELPFFVQDGTAVFAEQDRSPDFNVEFCELHSIYHRPGRCPICIGDYINDGRRK